MGQQPQMTIRPNCSAGDYLKKQTGRQGEIGNCFEGAIRARAPFGQMRKVRLGIQPPTDCIITARAQRMHSAVSIGKSRHISLLNIRKNF